MWPVQIAALSQGMREDDECREQKSAEQKLTHVHFQRCLPVRTLASVQRSKLRNRIFTDHLESHPLSPHLVSVFLSPW